jgi:nanoRNase/pAp phosphatase (c-di-AMP/oligoRNAs hydrolase)
MAGSRLYGSYSGTQGLDLAPLQMDRQMAQGDAQLRERIRAALAGEKLARRGQDIGVQQAGLDREQQAGMQSERLDFTREENLDHHPLRPETRRVKFHDIRTRFGATATMMMEYLKAARFRLDADLATALFYGIKAETQGLTREASRADRDAYLSLLPHVDFRKIFEIQYAGVSRKYFGFMGSALANTALYGDVAVTSLGHISNPDFCAEFCDMILRLETLRWALCVGQNSGIMYLSLRTRERNGHAGRSIARIVGKEGKAGGHGMMAGGIANIEKFDPATYEKAVDVITQRFLEVADAQVRTAEALLDIPTPAAIETELAELSTDAPVSS